MATRQANGRDTETMTPVPPDSEPLLPSAVRDPFARATRAVRPLDAAAALLLTFHLTLLLWTAGRGGPYRDDFRLQSMSVEQPLIEWLFSSPGSHFAPLPRLIIASQATFAPWDVGVATATTIALFAAQGIVMWLLLIELIGPRRDLLAIFLVYCLSPIFIPSAGWWTQAVTLTPASVGMLATLLFLTKYWRTQQVRYELAAWASYAVGLLSWEKALLTLPVAVMLVLLFLAPGPTWPERLRATLQLRRFWAGMALLTAAHLVYYVLGPFDTGGEPARAGPGVILTYLWTNLTSALLPGLAGGPWRWDTDTSPYFGIADPSLLMRLVAAVLVGVVLAGAARRDLSRTLRAVVLVLSVWIPGTAMLIVGRVTKFGISPAFDYRYLPEVAAVSVVALALALLPLRGEPVPAARRADWTARAMRVALVFYSVGAMVSIVTWGTTWHENPARPYAAQVREDLTPRDEEFRLYDTDLPTDVLSPLFAPYTRASRALGPFNREQLISFDASNPPAFVLTDGGAVRPAEFQTLASGLPGTASQCGYPVNSRSGPVVIPLDRRVPPLPDTFLRMSMLSGDELRLEVTVASSGGDFVVSPPEGLLVPEGLPAVLLRVDNLAVESVTVTFLSSDSGICVDKVLVGVPVPEST